MSAESERCLPRGTSLVSVVVQPQGEPLSDATITEIELRKGFAFAVTVANDGCAPETGITVNVGVEGGDTEVAGKGGIARIDPGEQATVNIRNLPLPVLEKKLLLGVEVEPVPTEGRVDNNSAEYPVRFVLG